jgi:hypothetical protein
MICKNLFKTAAVVSIALACMSVKCYCAEHPEHPTAAKPKPAGLTKEQLAEAIEAYIQKGVDANGNFAITDDKTGEKLQMKLVKVHRERLARVGTDQYFACVDFKSTEGKMYDVDFFMKGTAKDNLTFSEFMIHKVDGKPRYTWYEEKGIWKRKPVVERPKAEPNEKP